MPITIPSYVRRVSQQEFGAIAYRAMDVIFAVHNELGRFLEEDIYKLEIAHRIPGSETEVPITVSFENFSKPYFLDLLVEGAAPFELKAVEALAGRHRAQLVNYLLLMELPHGKLVNLRPDLVEHEFVNTTLTRTDRTDFEVLADKWRAPVPDLKPWLVAALADWGTGLDIHLYEQACTHFFGGPEKVLSEVEIVMEDRRLGTQPVRLAAPGVAFKVTTMSHSGFSAFEDHARRFLAHSTLDAIHWINIFRDTVVFKTLRQKD